MTGVDPWNPVEGGVRGAEGAACCGLGLVHIARGCWIMLDVLA